MRRKSRNDSSVIPEKRISPIFTLGTWKAMCNKTSLDKGKEMDASLSAALILLYFSQIRICSEPFSRPAQMLESAGPLCLRLYPIQWTFCRVHMPGSYTDQTWMPRDFFNFFLLSLWDHIGYENDQYSFLCPSDQNRCVWHGMRAGAAVTLFHDFIRECDGRHVHVHRGTIADVYRTANVGRWRWRSEHLTIHARIRGHLIRVSTNHTPQIQGIVANIGILAKFFGSADGASLTIDWAGGKLVWA